MLTSVIVQDREQNLRFVAKVGLLCGLGLLGSYALGLHGSLPLPLDRNGVPLGRDFLNTWFYGRAFFDHDPGRFYDRALYMHTVETIFPQDVAERLWSYPPPFLMLAAPFGRLPYVASLALWTAMGLLALGLAVRQKGSGWLVTAVLTAPIVVFAVIAGQVSLFVAALAVTAFAQLDRRPVLAGLLLAVLAIKPQAVILVPVLLIASRRWTVLASAAIGTVAIVILSVAVNGLDVWTQFVQVGLPAQVAEMKKTIEVLAPLSVTVTTAAIRAGAPPAVVSCLQGAATLLGVGLVAWVGWRGRGSRQSSEYEGLVVLACSAVAVPYLLIHDLAAFSAALVVVTYREGLIRNRVLLLAALYTPLMQGAFAELHLPIMPILLMGFAIWIAVRGRSARDLGIPSGAWATVRTAA